MAASPRRLVYRGIRPDGVGFTGATHSPAADFVERQYRRRVRALVVLDEATRQLVGAVERSVETGRRTWWAER
jgi:hypothetical protein